MLMVSIIIPCYNSEEYLHRSLQSAINQTYSDKEIIVVDNNSTDNTYQCLLEWQQRHPAIKVLQELKKGAPAARNKGLREAKGDWIQFLDSDDELLPDKIERQMGMVSETENLGLIVGDYLILKNENKKKIIRKSPHNKWIGLIDSNLGITCSNLFLRETLMKVRGWNEGVTSSQEYDLMFRMLKRGIDVSFDRTVSTIIHKRENSISNSDDAAIFQKILNKRIELRQDIRQYLISEGLYTQDIDIAFSKYVFRHLWFNKYKYPDYFDKKIKEYKLSVPTIYKYNRIIRTKLRHYLTTLLSRPK